MVDVDRTPKRSYTKVRKAGVSRPHALSVLVLAAGAGASAAALLLVNLSVLIAGLLFTLAMVLLLELSEHHRDNLTTAIAQLKERNADLERTFALSEGKDARLAAIVRSSSDLTTVVSADGTILFQSPSSMTMLGAGQETLVGKSVRTLVHPDDHLLWERALTQCGRTPGGEVSAEWRLRTSHGTYVSVETRMTNLLEDPAVAGLVVNSRDVTDRKRLEGQLRHQAFHDSLTGLANRALFEDRLENALARLARAQGTVGVVFFDLDDFKAVNDSKGHRVGDELLEAVSDRLRGTVRAGETLARIGGDEFAVLVEGGQASGAPEAAERILEALRRRFDISTGAVRIGASIGVVTTASTRHTAQEVLRNADIAMYAAKNSGKKRIELFRPGLHDRVFDRFQLETDLEYALDNDELSVHYQVLVDLTTSEVVGVEALMRWRHPDRGLLMPAEFISAAERTGLIVPMGQWLLKRACSDVRMIQQEANRPQMHLAVNLSARQLDDPDFVQGVEAALGESGLSPELLTLEITESVFWAHPRRSPGVFEHLKGLGVRLSIDDFGTGYSSLGYLQRVPIDEVKIDRTFVSAGNSKPVVQTIVGLAQNFGLDTVAAGIETEAQLRSVRDTGCQLAQGYLFAKPMAIGGLREALASSRH